MLIIITQLRRMVLETFPRGRHLGIIFVFVILGAAVPLIDLLVIQMFSSIIIDGSKFGSDAIVTQSIIFFGLFVVMRGVHFFQKTYKVTVIKKAFDQIGRERTRMQEMWDWTVAMELTNSLTDAVKLLVFLPFFAVISWQFGLVNLVIVLLSAEAIGRLFRSQLRLQAGFVAKRIVKREFTKPFESMSGRIRMSEISALVANGGFVVVLFLILLLSFSGLADPAGLVVLFLGSRMQTSTLSNLSSSLMRLARGRANQLEAVDEID